MTDLAPPPVPDEQNGAKLLEQAATWLDEYIEQSGGDDLVLLWYPTGAETDEEREKVRAHLAQVQPYFALIERIPERPAWRLDLAWHEGWEMSFDWIGWIQQATQYLRARVEFDGLEKGRTERAARTALLLLHLSERSKLPMVLGHLVRRVVREQPVEVLRIAQGQPGFDAALFRRLVDPRLMAAIPPTGPPAAVLEEERAGYLGLVRGWLAGESAYDPESFDDSLYRSAVWRPLLYRHAGRALDFYERAIPLCGTSPREALRRARDLREDREQLASFTYLSVSIIDKLFASYAQHVAVMRLARVVMALLEYRQEHQRWPESLAPLGEMPLDPYSGGPFAYEPTEEGARIRAAKEVYERVEGVRVRAVTYREWEALEEDRLAWTWEE
jgi:hypothetical protein